MDFYTKKAEDDKGDQNDLKKSHYHVRQNSIVEKSKIESELSSKVQEVTTLKD